MKGDRFFFDFVGRDCKTVRGIERFGDVYYSLEDFCNAARINRPKNIKTRLNPGEYSRANIGGRSRTVISIEGLMGIVPNKTEHWLARKCAAELVRHSEIRIEDIAQDEEKAQIAFKL